MISRSRNGAVPELAFLPCPGHDLGQRDQYRHRERAPPLVKDRFAAEQSSVLAGEQRRDQLSGISSAYLGSPFGQYDVLPARC
jgi:hypothetical protein